MGKGKILIVNNDANPVEDIRTALEKFNYKVTGIVSAGDSLYQGLEKIMPDVVVMDLSRPGKKDDVAIAEEIREKFMLPVILLAEQIDQEIAGGTGASDLCGYVMKPFRETELCLAIEMAMYKGRAEKKINHLTSVLRAIRNVNELIVRVDDISELIHKACEALISARGYTSAWIVLLDDEGKFAEFASSGFTEDSDRLEGLIRKGFFPDCIRCLESGIETCQLRHSRESCGDCPLCEAFPQSDILTSRIRYKEKHLGYMTVTTSASLLKNQEEIELFEEISEDIGLAITNIDRLHKKELAEQEIIRTRNEWEKTFDAIPDLIAIIDQEHRIVKANKAMAEKLKCNPDDAVGCFCFEVVHGLSRVPDFCPHARSLQTGKEEHNDGVVYNFGGIYDVTTTPLYDEDGNLTGSVHVARDITNRKKKEQLMAETLALSEYSLNHAMNDILVMAIDKAELLTGSQIGFFHFLDDDGKMISLQAWSTNTTKNFCTAKSNSQHYPIEAAGIWTDCIRERSPVIHNDYEALPNRKGLPEGHSSLLRELTIPIIRGDRVVAVIAVGNKSTEYDDEDIEIVTQLANLTLEFIISKKFEAALHESEQYARALLGAIPDLIFRMNREGVYLDYKGGSEDLHYQDGQIIGKNNRDMTPPEFADLIESQIRLTLEQGSMHLFEYQLMVPAKGMRDYEARMVPSGPDEVTAISRDITDRKKTDEALQKKIEQLEWYNHLMIDREVKMIELKEEINSLANRLGEVDRYVIHHK